MLIVAVILVAVVVWFIFAVVIPLLVINIAVITLILAGVRKQVSKFLLPLSVAGAALVVADYNQGWFTKMLVGNVAFFAGLIPVFLYLNIFAGLIAAYFLISNFLNKMSPLENGAGEFTRRNVITMVSLLLIGALTVGLQKTVDAQRATLKARMVAQAAEQARRAKANRIAERLRVEQALTGEWSSGSARLTITKEENKFKAEYPSSMGLQVLSGELQANNQLRLGNVKQLGKLVNPLTFYQGDFGQEAWIELGMHSSSLIVRFSQASGGRSIVMNRTDGNHREHKAAETLAPKPAPVVAPKSVPETDAQFWKRLQDGVNSGKKLDDMLPNADATMRFYHIQAEKQRGTRTALSTGGRANSNVLSVSPLYDTLPGNTSPGVGSVIKMARARVEERAILAFIASSSTPFGLNTVDQIITARQEGLSDKVLCAMLERDRFLRSKAATKE